MSRLHLSYDLFVYDFTYDYFGIVGGYKLRRMCLHCLLSPCDLFRRQTRTNARSSCSHRVIFTTSLYKSHDARMMTLRKSQGVGTLTVQLSCKYMYLYVHGFKQSSMFFLGCTDKSCYEEASVFVDHGPKVWD